MIFSSHTSYYYLLLFGLDKISEKIISFTIFSLSKVKEFENISFSLSTITRVFFQNIVAEKIHVLEYDYPFDYTLYKLV